MPTKYFTVDDAYQRNKELKKEYVLLLQEWLVKQPHLPKISEVRLIVFLHSCYYKIEPTKTCIDNFYTLKAHWPEFSLQRNIFSDDMQRAFQALLATVLPLHTKQNHKIMYSRLLNTNPDAFDHTNNVKAFDMISAAWMRVIGTCDGYVHIMDTEGASFGHLVKTNILTLKRHMSYVQDALPVRLKAVHIINVSPIIDRILNLAKPFIRHDFMDIIHLHSKIDTLYEYVPKSSMPNEFGGKAGTFQELHDKQMELLKENSEFLMAEEKEIADESRRQGKSKYYDEIFGGIEGTFKKLDID